MNETELVTTGQQDNPLAHLPEALQKKILAARQNIESSSAMMINRVTFSPTKYRLPDGTEADTFVGVIVGVKHANVHYPAEYNRDEVTPPDCVAVMPIGEDKSCNDLIPSAFVQAKYAEKCSECHKFEFGSKGKGKACFEHTLLAVYIPSVGDQLVVLEARKGNSRTCDAYIRNMSSKMGHPIAVLTRFTIGAKKDWEQTYEFDGVIAPDLLENVSARMDEAEELLYNRVAGAYRAAEVPDTTSTSTQTSGRKSRGRG
jgi:hypothetical protein